MVRAAVAVVALSLSLGVGSAARAAGWSHPFRFAGPLSQDVLAPQLGVSASGQAAVTFSVQDEDHPAVSQAMIVLRSSRGRLSELRVPGAQQVLALGFAGQAVELLTGSSARGRACCSTAQTTGLQRGGFQRPQTLVPRLTGASTGRLATLPGARLLAALATDRGVWAAQSITASRFGAAHRLSGPGSWPQSLDAITLSGGRSVLAWSAAGGASQAASSIATATGTVTRPPRGSRIAVRVPAGHAVDELAIAPSSAGATAAWIESWFDSTGAYRSLVVVADLTAKLRPRTFQVPGLLAGGLSFAADAAGDQLLAFRACDQSGACVVEVAARNRRGRYGRLQALGAIDPTQEPTASLSAGGKGLVGWIDQGHVLASDRRSGAAGFGAPRVVSATNYGADLTLSFGPGGQALAAWTQGTLAPSVMGALYRP